jgi:valyl-tRNA synthetase
LDLSGMVDFGREKERLSAEIAQLEKYAGIQSNKLANAEFVKNAPAAVVAKEKEKLSGAREDIAKLQNQLSALK